MTELPGPRLPTLRNPRDRHLRQAFLIIVTGSCVVMVPWLAYLASLGASLDD